MSMTSMSGSNNVVVIGGGAAGMMAAGTAASLGAHVTLLEPNGKLGKKLFITGKGRCNVTNNCTSDEVLKNVPVNPRFLYSALSGFSPADAMAFFEAHGCKLKTERGNRVFPVSDRSHDIANALERAYAHAGGRVLHAAATDILTRDGAVSAVVTTEGTIDCGAAVVCTGGMSYPLTGSTGDGFRFAKELGLSVTALRPSLVPLETEESDAAEMQGLSLKNTALTVTDRESGKVVYTDFGEMLFTHFGLSGPLVLSASAHMRHFGSQKYRVEIDLKPALDEKTLDERLLRDFEKYANRDFSHALDDLLPRSMIPVVIARSGIDPLQKVNSITKQQRRALLETIKCFSVPIACKAPVEDAIVTSGGVKVSEINPKTMESKLVPGLYFAGEIIDCDAYTGGFNLQIAWATAYAAAMGASGKINH